MDIDDAAYTSDIRLDGLRNEPRRLKCAYCKRKTNHKILKSVEDTWSHEYGMEGKQNHLIVQCLGCEVLSYCKESSDNETWHSEKDEKGKDKVVFDINTEQYPTVNVAYNSPFHFASMPKNVSSIYHDTHKALIHGMDKLGAVGVRVIVEMVCLDHGIKKGKLNKKIDELNTRGYISSPMRDLLHNVRLFGNHQAHGTEEPDFYELIEAWEALNNFLSSLYGTNDANYRFKLYNENSKASSK